MLAVVAAAAASACELLVPEGRNPRSRHVDLLRYTLRPSSVRCELHHLESDPPADVWRVTWDLWEHPPAEHAAGFRVLARHDGSQDTVAGTVADDSSWIPTAGGRKYTAGLMLPRGGAFTVELLYRAESKHFWETWYGEKIEGIVKNLRNKKNTSWTKQVPSSSLSLISLHHTPLFSKPILLRTPDLPSPRPAVPPLCEDVGRIAAVGAVRRVRAPRGGFPDGVWEPANCRLRTFTTDDDWAAFPSRLRVRVMGDSSFQHMLEKAPSLFRFRGGPALTHVANKTFVVKAPTGGTITWRYFRGVGCADGVMPWVDPVLCPSSKPLTKSACAAVYGLDEQAEKGLPGGFNSVFVTAAWWVASYRRANEWALYGKGLRRALDDCSESMPERRKRSSIFWVSPIATNQTHGLNDGVWRPLWNDRLSKFDSDVQTHLLGAVDGVVPYHRFTSAWKHPASTDVHRHRDLRQLFVLILNYAIWGQKRARTGAP
eukprot:TRINITY_DN6963_c0_g1_i1.p1 TRINITY_DN6963_c0_g1~~TRINITY_DN6963_c0_g1_i1.p1  ORF type:complete len:486 (+),score=122.24 TRINITY_DN6963_c0_g1_i1:82-1539(+)